MKLKKTLILCLFLLLIVSVNAQVIYVKANATGSGNGTSWANAYTSLQPALAAATSGKQIWVAKGTYKPTVGTDRAASFQMKSGVKIYGGFTGTETSISLRTNYGVGGVNETILSGDIGTAGINTDNSYHVLFNSGIDNAALLDGFTITGGYADNYSETDATHAEGGGILNLNSSPEISNCCFTQNYAYFGGGMLSQESSPTITNCTFNSNSVLYQGGAIFNYHTVLSLGNSALSSSVNSSSVIEHSFFFNNTAESGGGICNYQSNPSVGDCVFEGNDVGDNHGGAIYNYESAPTYSNCIFRKNHAKYGGGIYNGMNSSATIQNCLFVKNWAEFGGGIENFQSSPGIVNCTFYGNYIDNYFGGGAVGNDEKSNPTIKNSIFQNNYRTNDDSLANLYNVDFEKVTYCCFYRDPKIYPGEGNIYDYAAFTDTSGVDGIIGTADDDFSLKKNSPCIGAGTVAGAPATDILGITRGTPPDMGAYENELNVPEIKIIYVNVSATGKNDGTSWTNAFTSLLPALNEASVYDQVWVAKGTYKPTTGTDRSVSFSMKNRVKLYGGFVGTEAELSFRKNDGPGEANETILSGNIGDEADSTDNSYHVFFHPEGVNLERSTVIEGFTIRDGYASGLADNWETWYGGGMFNYNSSPTIKNCLFTNNKASGGGGAMFNDYYSSPEIRNCAFTNNLVFGTYLPEEGGGGIYNYYNSSPAISYCHFEKNTAYVKKGSAIVSSGGGGGIFNEWSSSPSIDHCYFTGNYAQYNGDGVNYNGSVVNVSNSVFDGNSGDGLHAHGNGIITNCLFINNRYGVSIGYQTPLKIVNCTFSKNIYGLLSDHYSTIQVLNSVFWGNSPEQNSTYELMYVNDNSLVSHCCIRDGATSFPGNDNIYTNPLFADAAHGDFHLSAGSPCISKGLNPAENNLIPLVDLDGNSRPMGSKTDLGAYECRDDGTVPGATTFVLSNEEGGLIDELIADGYGNGSLYDALVNMQETSGGTITDEFLEVLAGNPGGSPIFTTLLSTYAHLNGGVAINADGTVFTTTTIKGLDYHGETGYSTYPPDISGTGREIFTYANSPEYYINAVNGSTIYKVFAIAWSQAPSSTLSVSTNTLNVALANGSTASFNVNSNISWSVVSSQSWLSVSPENGSGNGTVTVTAEANPTASARTAIVTISGSGVTSQTVTVTQLAGAATLSVSTNSLNVASANGSTATFNVTSNISWTAASDQSWLTVNPANGTGNGTVTVTAQANSTATTCTATVTVSGSGVTSQTITVTQAAGAATLSVSTSTLSVASANGSTSSFNVTSNTSWSATCNQTWLTLNPLSGSSNGAVTITAEANPSVSERTAIITVSASGVASQTITVTQITGNAILSVSSNTLDILAAEGSTATFNIISNVSWSVVSDQTWLAVNVALGSGNGSVTLTSAKNETTEERTAIVTVSASGVTSQIVTITQAASEATLLVSPLALDVTATSGSTATFNVTSNTRWSLTSDQSWLSVNPTNGTGNGTVTVTAQANPTASARSETVTVSGSGVTSQTVTVTQAAGEATLTVSPLTIDIAATGGDTTITITSNTSWTVVSDQNWLTVVPLSGSGNGTVTLTLDVNPSSSARSATITVSGTGVTSQTVTVTQPGTVGVLDNELAKIRVYPNPFSDGFYVCSSGNATIVSVFDIRGRMIFTRKISGNEFIPSIQFEKGIYLLELTNDRVTIKKKLIKN